LYVIPVEIELIIGDDLRMYFLIDIAAGGITTDYYYVKEGILHSYTIELRDLGEYAVFLPPNQILDTSIETWNGIKAMLAVI